MQQQRVQTFKYFLSQRKMGKIPKTRKKQVNLIISLSISRAIYFIYKYLHNKSKGKKAASQLRNLFDVINNFPSKFPEQKSL